MKTKDLFQLGIALLPMVKTGVTEFIAWITTLKVTLQQTGEWTDEENEAYRQSLLKKGLSPEEIPDPKEG